MPFREFYPPGNAISHIVIYQKDQNINGKIYIVTAVLV